MSFFDFFRASKKQQPQPGAVDKQEIPVSRSLFVDDREPDMPGRPAPVPQPVPELKGIDAVYDFMQNDFEQQGYEDALAMPDWKYMQDNVELIMHDLRIIIQKACSWYEEELLKFEYHIATRSRAGLMDLVEELKAKQNILRTAYEKVKEIGLNSVDIVGMPLKMKLAYEKGFRRGLEAISRSTLLADQPELPDDILNQ